MQLIADSSTLARKRCFILINTLTEQPGKITGLFLIKEYF